MPTKQQILDAVSEMPDGDYDLSDIGDTVKKAFFPAEPTDRGAVIEDSEGDLWVLTFKRSFHPWEMAGDDNAGTWLWLNEKYGPVKILCHGA